MNIEDLINILKTVQHCHLRLFDYAQLILGEDGRPDHEKVMFYAKELTEATDEAKAYAKETRSAVACLKKIAHSQS